MINAKRILIAILLATITLCPLASCTKKQPDDTTSGNDTTDTTEQDEIITLPEYDFSSLDLSAYIKLPSDYLNRDYSEGLTLKGAVTDEDIDEYIKTNVLKSLATKKELTDEGIVQDLDTVIMDYTGKLDGVAFAGGSATDAEHAISISNSTFIDGFDRGLIGMKTGETKDLELTFPDPYPNNPDLAGKAVIFPVTVDKIIRYEYPELSDALISENSAMFGDDIKTADQLKETAKDSLTAEIDSYNNNLKVEAAWKYMTESSEFVSLPSDILDSYKSTYLKSYEQSAKQNSTTLEQYALTNGYLSLDDFKEKVIYKAAEDLLKEKLVLHATAKALDISFSDEQARELANEEFKLYVEPNLAYYTMALGISDLESYISYMGGLSAYKENLTFSEIVKKLCKLDESHTH